MSKTPIEEAKEYIRYTIKILEKSQTDLKRNRTKGRAKTRSVKDRIFMARSGALTYAYWVLDVLNNKSNTPRRNKQQWISARHQYTWTHSSVPITDVKNNIVRTYITTIDMGLKGIVNDATDNKETSIIKNILERHYDKIK